MTVSPPADAPPPELNLTDALVQLSFIVQAVLGRLAGEQGLSVTQLRMLAVLDDREIGMRQLAGILELEKSSVTGLVDRAERRGLVQRIAVPGNRRAVHVTVTSAGRAVVHQVRDAIDTELGQLAATLSESRQDTFRRTVESLIHHYATEHAIPL
ncbi:MULTISPECIES: MarR family winged helix-turn-helix transcriptional regulator [Amycolatopsis]|uniref:MarR family transcriptional regulator n=1 Tax=Amycolatopsis dendrobii TaxID=2760662 RepID=A0A7W3VV37_9PSEU|nr:MULTISPECIES: MarR family transcriptional regulator [Amycolatopsis]MBB1153586.1 MarR family transcriptional regulator [Amycolatopsis dendrobii]UKD55667.1 MarR family transcriptional regulator [Amycolatopsis sp. FU40]